MTNRDYSKGKVYKIIANNAPEDEKVYVGSTTKQYLSQRLTAHKRLYQRWKNIEGAQKHAMAYDLFDKYGFENCSIILLEAVECNSKDQLLAREKHYYLTLNCINKKSPISTAEETAKQERDYYHLNKDKAKKYNEENKEIISMKHKIYYQENKERLKENTRLNNLNSPVVVCACGTSCKTTHVKKHEHTIRHQNFIKQNLNPI